MLDLFIKGGPIMWPILVTSIVALTVVIERTLFTLLELSRRNSKTVEEILQLTEEHKFDQALTLGRSCKDSIARVLTYGLMHRGRSFNEAILRAANKELMRYQRGLSALDTIVTLAPLLGLLGTVTGMIRAFGLLGASELSAPTAITGGIAEALIATAFGLGVAILALIPLNFLNTRLEAIRLQIQEAASLMEEYLKK